MILYFNSFHLPKDPTLTKPWLAPSHDSEILVLKFLARAPISSVTLGKSFSPCCISTSNPHGEDDASRAGDEVISDGTSL